MAVLQLCEPGALDIRRPLPGRAAVPQRVLSVAASQELGRIAVATSAPWFPGMGELLVLEPRTGRPPLRLPLSRGTYGAVVRDLVFSQDGATLTASLGGADEQHVASLAHWSLDGPVELWRRSASRSGCTTDGDAGHVRLAVSRDGGTVAGCDQNSHNVIAIAAASGRQLFSGEEGAHAAAPIGGTGAITVDAEGARLAFRLSRDREPAPDGGVAVLDLADGSHTTYPTGMGWCCGLAFCPDGGELAVIGMSAGTVVATVLDLAEGPGRRGPWTELGELPWEARQQCVRPVWSANGPRVAVRSGDTVTVWDLAEARPLHSVAGMGRDTSWNLTPDGRALITANPEGLQAHFLG
ncbi:WD40 repeat domain-containing protein [Streptomyces sp. ACA25]|uniref:WD40 repeat domain-containing protein n=1 Tax=Streptomyces sp. ACA25 TaxID=3022596 RepID=UPI002308125A|nr:WD40 repeat domain-containing protein [Streptomyces sp. ACA25]MDB1087520.1 WD40 repeat domain-containing protein [Streptomyces sp. ACA25]